MQVIEAYIFDVAPDGVISLTDIPEPRTRRDVFGTVNVDGVNDCEGLIWTVRDCEPLAQHFRRLAQSFVMEHTGTNTRTQALLSPYQPARLQLILRALCHNHDDGWQSWVLYSGDHQLGRFLRIVRGWLDAPIDWSEVEHFSVPWNGQQAASRYFQRLPQAIQLALGVEIEEGHPLARRFCTARLAKSVRAANAVAELLELDCRFSRNHACPNAEVQHG